MRFYSTLLLLFGCTAGAWAQHSYELDLNAIKNDALTVKMKLAQAPKQAVVRYSFPATVPGTYDTQDFGRFVLSFNAYDAAGKKLKVKKDGNNTFVISSATSLDHIDYTVEDIMDRKVKKHPIFQPVATNFDAGKNFLFNNGGIFGFFEGEEKDPINITIRKPADLFGATSLPAVSVSPGEQKFRANSYHQLMDCPMMFSVPDTVMFRVGKTQVTLSVFDVQGKKRAHDFYAKLKRDMDAVDAFLPDLPVDKYTFIVYVDDLKELGDALTGKLGLAKKIKLALKFKNLGLGALEHGNSSTYYLADFGNKIALKELNVDEQLTGAAIHEFMHIITPLGLHSQHIGNFNYTHPVMSKHLWLYEGITEYFAQLIKYEGKVYSPKEYLTEMEGKLSAGAGFPYSEMSFTEMSANVLEEKYHKQYSQVYTRGAVLGMLLDAEIQRLTKGKKKLLDVMLTLNARYGADKSFDEDKFIGEFVAEVHPDLKNFFDTYIEGRNQWEPNKQLDYIGIVYHDSLTEKGMLSPIAKGENDVVTKPVGIGLEVMIVKTGPNEWAGLQAGDVVSVDDYRNAFRKDNKDAPEGAVVKLRVKRKEQDITLDIKVKYGDKKRKNALRWKDASKN